MSPNPNCTGAAPTEHLLQADAYMSYERRSSMRNIRKAGAFLPGCFYCSDGDTISCKYRYIQGHYRTFADSYGHNSVIL
jgi:hypothetical protein